jgi:(p)ppGpp synthase/HD superfamily hydrolase
MNPTGDILAALQFAAFKHRDQRRKDHAASPYINHPIALAKVLWHEGGVRQGQVICAALLHDTIEDTQTTADEIEAAFGVRIARIVLEVTDDKLPAEGGAQAPPDRARAASFAGGEAREARRQDLQPARRGRFAPTHLVAAPPAPVFRLGEEGG